MTTSRSHEETVQEMEETFGMVPPPLGTIPEEDADGEWAFFHKYTVGESAIPPKYRELIGVAVAANIKCPYCAHFHRTAARMHGASEEELEEVYALSSLTPRYSAMLHAQQYDLDQFESEIGQIADHLEAKMAGGD